MMTIPEIHLFQVLKNRLGENEAEAMVGYVKNEVKHEFSSRKDVYATKEDLRKLQSGIMKEIYATKEDIGKLRSDMMKSIYGAGLVQLLVILSSVLTIVAFLSN